MATVRQYYDSDFKDFIGPEGPVPLSDASGAAFSPPVMWKMLQSFDSRACFFALYIPATMPLAPVAHALIEGADWILAIKDGLKMSVGFPNEPMDSLFDCVFTGRFIIYVEGSIDAKTKEELVKQGTRRSLAVVIRDHDYLKMRENRGRPLAFISHDSRDKADIARPLAESLILNLCQVWYDDFSLNAGDSLREKIEEGIKECERCVLILTPNFLSNTGWSKKEFDSIFTRELIERANIVLPVWAGVSATDVYNYSPTLADKVGIDWSEGLEVVTRKLMKALLP